MWKSYLWGRFNDFINKSGYHDGGQKYFGKKVWDLSFLTPYLKSLHHFWSENENAFKIQDFWRISLEKNTHKFRMMIFHFRINSCIEMLKWRATRHLKAENLNFVPQKCECPLGKNHGLILNFGTMRKTLEKHDILILRCYFGTTRCHDGTQDFLKKTFDTSALT